MLSEGVLDVLILGGGVNGAGVARDLALRARRRGRRMRIGLAEQGHFSSGTSGKNSHLIHGGLRYLKYFEIRLVREALRERAVLAELAPHLVEPLPFLIPMTGWFEALYYEAGLVLYDLLAGKRNFGRHRRLSRGGARALEPGLDLAGMRSAAMYYDARVESSRLVLENIFDAMRCGVAAVNYLRAVSRERAGGGEWRVVLRDEVAGSEVEARARKIVDATGAWMEGQALRLVRGSHLVYPKFHAGEQAVAYFEPAGRIVFFIPWGERLQLTLVGTTDIDHEGSPDEVAMSAEERGYLREMVARVFPKAAGAEPVSEFSSLRPLVRDESASATSTSREHRIWNDGDNVLRIAGGKYTTYRSMSEEAVDLLAAEMAPELAAEHPTRVEAVGGNGRAAFDRVKASVAGDPDGWIARLYGMEAPEVLALRPAAARAGLTRLEAARIRYAVDREMAQRLSDVLFGSTYLGYERRWDRGSLEPFAAELGERLGRDGVWVEGEVEAVLRRAAG